MLKETALIRTTKQTWKLFAALAFPSALGILILFRLESGGEGVAWFEGRMVLLTAAAFICFAYFCLSIRCPGCGLRMFRADVARTGFLNWVKGVLSATECPGCGFSPAREAGLKTGGGGRRNKQPRSKPDRDGRRGKGERRSRKGRAQ